MPKRKEQPTIEDLKLLTREELSKHLSLSTDTLKRWAAIGKGPRFIRFSEREIRYRLRDVLAWLDQLEAVESREL